jgi:hypothetical protein
MNGFIKRELVSSDYGRHFEFVRKSDGEVVELIAQIGLMGTVPGPDVLVNAHVKAAKKNGQMFADQLVIVS